MPIAAEFLSFFANSALFVAVGSSGIASTSALAGPTRQKGWSWCSKCQGMFYSKASSGLGVCPADHKPHTKSGSGDYYQMVGEDIAGVQQGGWRWCSKCQGMFYDRDSKGKGVCPAGAAHIDSGSGHYAIALGQGGAGRQVGWRWCSKCEGLFYSASSAGMGVCPDGGSHTQGGSGQYVQLT